MPAHDNPDRPDDMAPAVALLQMISGAWISAAIYVAAKLGIADFLKDGPRSCDELAGSTGAHARSLYRLLRGLASVGVFAEVGGGVFGLTSLAEYLRSDIPDSMRAMAIMCGEDPYRAAWANLLHSVRTGETAFEHIYKLGRYQYLTQNPKAAEVFNAAMTSFTAQMCTAVVKAYDFSGFERIVDVGGGQGALIRTILEAHPHLSGVLFDRPPVIEGARRLIEAAGLGGRCELVAGDFFVSVPGGADAYIISHVIHNWDDDRSIATLKNCRRAMARGEKLLVVEEVIPPGNDPSYGKLMDLNMLVMTGGLERTEAEYRALYTASGFELTRVIPTASLMSVIEGIPA